MELSDNQLILAWQNEGNVKARNELVLKHLAYVKTLSRKFHENEREEYFQLGVLGLMRAADLFDVDKGFTFLTYASNWIRHEFNNYFLKNCNHGVSYRGKGPVLEKIAYLSPDKFETEKEMEGYSREHNIPLKELRSYCLSQTMSIRLDESYFKGEPSLEQTWVELLKSTKRNDKFTIQYFITDKMEEKQKLLKQWDIGRFILNKGKKNVVHLLNKT